MSDKWFRLLGPWQHRDGVCLDTLMDIGTMPAKRGERGVVSHRNLRLGTTTARDGKPLLVLALVEDIHHAVLDQDMAGSLAAILLHFQLHGDAIAKKGKAA